MEIKAVLAEAVSSIRRARKIHPLRSDVEVAALRWELYASLQNILDAIAMMASDLGLRKPSSYASLATAFYEAGLVGEEVRDDVKVIVVTRNMLAHAYRRLEVGDLIKIVNEVLPKAEGVVEGVGKILEDKGVDPMGIGGGKRMGDLARLAEVFKKHGVLLAYLYGSRVKGFERVDSDYDIAVFFGKSEVSVMDEVELAVDMESLGVPADKVDVVALNNADSTLKARVLREGVPIYTADGELKARWEREAYLEVLRETDLHAVYMARIMKNIRLRRKEVENKTKSFNKG